MKRKLLILGVVLVVAVVAGALWWTNYNHRPPEELLLHGNTDLRQVLLAFNNSERISAVLKQEGEQVREGEVLARLDVSRIEPQVAEAEAQLQAQKEVVRRLKAGSRPEEIARARANVDSAQADASNAQVRYDRLNKLAETNAVNREQVDDAKAELDMAVAKLAYQQKTLDLAVLGPREEEIAEAEARLKVNEARLKLLQQQLADAQLVAPTNAIVRTRLLEPGEMASPQKPVYSLALTDPKWIRAYVSESDLGRVHPGMPASISVDSFPKRRFEGWIGFVSPVAEFTPKTVQTEELRTSLVYEVRVFVKDPGDDLRLGMPATVHIALSPNSPPPADVHGATSEATGGDMP